MNFARRVAYRTAMFIVSIFSVVAIWELYKIIGPQDGGKFFGVSVLPRANNTAMPHVSTMLSRYSRPEVRGSDKKIWAVVLSGAWFSLRLSLVGFFLGTTIGVGLAVLMARFNIVKRGLLPYLVMSQTVPLIALAPLVVSWVENSKSVLLFGRVGYLHRYSAHFLRSFRLLWARFVVCQVHLLLPSN